MKQEHKTPTPHPNMHRYEKTRTSCPNKPRPVHVKDGGSKERPLLTVDQMRDRLYATNLHPGGTVPMKAYELGRRYGLDSDDLMQAAVVRSLGTKTIRPDLPPELYLAQVMRSIGSGVARARLRARERREGFEYTLGAQIVGWHFALGTEERLRFEAEQIFYAALLEELAGGDERVVKLIDGIGQDLRGSRLAEFVGITHEELATLRRTLKRRSQAVAKRECLIDFHQANFR